MLAGNPNKVRMLAILMGVLIALSAPLLLRPFGKDAILCVSGVAGGFAGFLIGFSIREKRQARR